MKTEFPKIQPNNWAAMAKGDPEPSPLGWADLLCITVCLLFMAMFYYVRSRNRIFWDDETLASMVLRDKTFGGMMQAWRASIDSGSLFYEIAGRYWLKVFSSSELSLRAFSATGMAASFVLMWLTARRFFSLAVVVSSLPMAYFLNDIVNWHYYNGRMYGSFMAASALVVYAFVRASPGQPPMRRILLLTFLAHLFLLSTHILGPLYSGTFIAGLAVQDLAARQFRWKLYLSALAGWLVLPLSYENVKNTVALSKHGYFTVTPHWRDFAFGLAVFSRRTEKALYILLAAAALSYIFARSRQRGKILVPAHRPIYFVLLCFFSILVVAYGVSHVVQSIFYERYLLPVYLADALLICVLVDSIFRNLGPRPLSRNALLAAAMVVFLLVYRAGLKSPLSIPEHDYTEGLLAKVPAGVPIVITDAGMFVHMAFYRNDRAVMVYPLDWQVALDKDAGPGGANDTVALERMKIHGYYSAQILSSPQILAQFPEFLLVNLPVRNLWFRRYVRDNPKYNVVSEGMYHGDELWLVKTRSR